MSWAVRSRFSSMGEPQRGERAAPAVSMALQTFTRSSYVNVGIAAPAQVETESEAENVTGRSGFVPTRPGGSPPLDARRGSVFPPSGGLPVVGRDRLQLEAPVEG